ncbi:MAG: hypothetical protein ACR2PM_06475 [Hyphomicrobiales bacterium]
MTTPLLRMQWARDPAGYTVETRLTDHGAPSGGLLFCGEEASELNPDEEIWIVGRSGQKEHIDPQSIGGDRMFLEFANMKLKPETAVAFANKYGLMLDRNEPGERFQTYLTLMESMDLVIKLWNMRKYLEIQKVFSGFGLGMTGVEFTLVPGSEKPRLVIKPNSLIELLYLQCAQTIADKEAHSCVVCGQIFVTNINMRAAPCTCSDTCQQRLSHDNQVTRLPIRTA